MTSEGPASFVPDEDRDAAFGKTELNRAGTRQLFPVAAKDRNAWAGLDGRDRPALDMDGWRRALGRRRAARACRFAGGTDDDAMGSASRYTRSLGLGSNLE